MLMPATPELIQVMIADLLVERNARAAFVMNRTMQQEAQILDKRINNLRQILEMDSVPKIDDMACEWPRWDESGNRVDDGWRL